MDREFIQKYLKDFANLILLSSEITAELVCVKDILVTASENGKKVIIVGNGGSSAMASHVSVDLTKNAGIRCINFNESDLITCFANDYGYENWVTEAIKAYCFNEDLIILISSSGTSKNIVNAAQYCNENNIKLITLSGFKYDNPLSKLGNVNFHVKSSDYNFIEMIHHIILVSIVDIFAKKIF